MILRFKVLCLAHAMINSDSRCVQKKKKLTNNTKILNFTKTWGGESNINVHLSQKVHLFEYITSIQIFIIRCHIALVEELTDSIA